MSLSGEISTFRDGDKNPLAQWMAQARVLEDNIIGLEAMLDEFRVKHAALEARLREAVDLLHRDLGAYKSEMPHMAQEIEDFLGRYESEAK